MNPFDVIPIDKDKESVKVWDFYARDWDGDEGRIRILAVVPKLPLPLDNIKFSAAYCAPEDLKRFTKKKSNNILVGRWLASFGPGGNGTTKHTGIVSVDTLKGFPFKAISSLGDSRPYWIMGIVDEDIG